jgi:DNA-binding response OmpR family regulator
MLANGPRAWPSRPNGRAGLEKLKNQALDIVLLDIGLRFGDGRLRTPNGSESP